MFKTSKTLKEWHYYDSDLCWDILKCHIYLGNFVTLIGYIA